MNSPQSGLQTDPELVRQTLNKLDDDVAAIDSASAHRLAAARREALAQLGQSSRSRTWLHPAWTLSAATAVGIVAMLLIWQPSTVPEQSGVASAADSNAFENLSILSASDDLEFYQSMDFLIWMEQNAG